MTGTDLCVNKPQSVPVIFEPPCILDMTKQRITALNLLKFTSQMQILNPT